MENVIIYMIRTHAENWKLPEIVGFCTFKAL